MYPWEITVLEHETTALCFIYRNKTMGEGGRGINKTRRKIGWRTEGWGWRNKKIRKDVWDERS
jgi:hypothetical protein